MWRVATPYPRNTERLIAEQGGERRNTTQRSGGGSVQHQLSVGKESVPLVVIDGMAIQKRLYPFHRTLRNAIARGVVRQNLDGAITIEASGSGHQAVAETRTIVRYDTTRNSKNAEAAAHQRLQRSVASAIRRRDVLWA